MSIEMPFAVANAAGLPVPPTDFENDLFKNPAVTSWYTADAEYVTTTTQSGITRATGIKDRTPNGKDLSAIFARSFVWDPVTNVDAAIGGHAFLRSDDSTKCYVSPISPWPTGDHFKLFLFKAATPAANRYLQGATGVGTHRVLLSTLDRIIADVGTAQQILTRDPSKWNLAIETWDATTGSVGLLVNSRGFTSSPASAAVCGTTSPTFGSNTGAVTGASCNYRHWATGNVDLRKPAGTALFSVILEFFTTFEDMDLGV